MKHHSPGITLLLIRLGILALGISLTLQVFASTSIPTPPFAAGGTRPLKITCLTIGSRGDVQPFIALGIGLQQDGHEVTIATHLEFQKLIEDSGIAFKDIGGNPQELIKHCVEYGFFSPEFYIEGYIKFRKWIDELMITVPEACKGTDVLIESPTAMMGIHVAESMKIPYFRAFTMPWTPTRKYPHPFAVTSPQLGKYYNRMSYNIFNYLVWKGIESKVNTWREKKLELKPTSFAKLRTANVPYLYNFSKYVVPKPRDWDDKTHVTGYWFVDQQKKIDQKKIEDSISPDLRSFLKKAKDNNKKVIYIGFGSVIFPNAQKIQRILEHAVRKAGVWAVVSGGWSGMKPRKAKLESLESSRSQHSPIHYVGAVPHEWLFSQVDATLTHGGAGTTAASLRAGIPTLIKPFFGDQFFWANLVKKMGVGAHVLKFDVSELARVFKTATTNPDQIRKAERVGQAIRGENGVRKAIEKIYEDMNYARGLMMRGLAKDKGEPIPEFPREKVYSRIKQFLRERRSSIHYFLLFIVRGLQYYSTQQQSLGDDQDPKLPPQSGITRNITTSEGNHPQQTKISQQPRG